MLSDVVANEVTQEGQEGYIIDKCPEEMTIHDCTNMYKDKVVIKTVFIIAYGS